MEDLDTVFKRVIQARSSTPSHEAYETLVANIDPPQFSPWTAETKRVSSTI